MILLNVAEALNDVTRPDENGTMIDSLMAGQGDAVLDTDDIDYETEHDSRLVKISETVDIYLFINMSGLRLSNNQKKYKFGYKWGRKMVLILVSCY